MVGRTISHYEIVKKLGEGGMGVVYKALDTHLDRFVAIKVLPPEKVTDPERKRRFVQEAKAASALNHPNIITIHDIGQSDGIDFISMEYVAGKPLDGMIPRHGMRLHEVLECAVQIADALTRAHSAGIIHRDLKPSNIMVDEHGVVKILDFGLAKLTEVRSLGKDALTRTIKPVTEEGKIVGTVAYMSPEQARGEELDARTDLFSFGVVLYEMTTGQRPFQGDTAAVVFNAILAQEPVPPEQLNPQVPAKLVEIINKALEKDPDVRYQNAADLRADLKRLKRDTESGRAVPPIPVAKKPARSARAQRWIWIGVTAIVLAAAAAFWLAQKLPPPRVLGATQITRDGHQKISPFNVQSLWTDGSRLYFNEEINGSWQIAQVSAMGGETQPFPTSISTPLLLSMAPNRSELLVQGFVSNDPIAPIWLIPALGGMPRRLGDIRANDAAFSPDGTHIVYAMGGEVYQANLDGTESRKLMTIASNVLFPRFSPDGGVLRLTLVDRSKTASRSIWEARSDGTGLRLMLPDWNRPHNEACGAWTPDGRFYIFEAVREGTTTSNLWALRERGGLFGKPSQVPIQLTAGPLDYHMPVPSPDGRRLYAFGVQQRAELVRYDAKSRQFLPFLSAIWAEQVDFSRDGSWVAYVLYPEGTLWRSKLDGTERLQLTFPPMQALMPRWSPDNRRIAFSGGPRGKIIKIYSVAAEGGTPEQLTTGERADVEPSWAVDGDSLVFGRDLVAESRRANALAIQVLQLKTRQVSVLPGSEGLWYPRCSPDGRYVSALTANSQSIMLFNTATQKWSELIKTVVNSPVWSLDSQHIYFDSYPTRDAAVFRVGIRDHKLERVGNLEGFRRAESAVLKWPWMGLAPDGSPLLVRDIGTQEIYALDWQAP